MHAGPQRLHVVMGPDGPRRIIWQGRLYEVVNVRHLPPAVGGGRGSILQFNGARRYFRLELQAMTGPSEAEFCVVDVFVQRGSWVLYGVPEYS